MVLNPDATSSSEILPVPGAANKSNWPSALGAAFLAVSDVFSFEVPFCRVYFSCTLNSKSFCKIS